MATSPFLHRFIHKLDNKKEEDAMRGNCPQMIRWLPALLYISIMIIMNTSTLVTKNIKRKRAVGERVTGKIASLDSVLIPNECDICMGIP